MLRKLNAPRWVLPFASVVVLLFGTLWPAVGRAQDGELATLRANMREIFHAVEVLIPLSVDDQAFFQPANAAQIRASLRKVEDHIGSVGQHAGQGDRRLHFLAKSLELEAGETLRQFELGQLESAQFFAQRLTDFCVACHSRLPSPRDSPLAQDFVSDAKLAELAPEQRAVLQVATRRFDDALSSLESVIVSPMDHAAELLDPVTRYLTVAIRVKKDLERPIPTLRKLAKRPDLWSHLRSDVLQWVETLERLRNERPQPPSLARARSILAEARSLIRFPTDRLALVHYLRASSELHSLLELHKGESGAEVAEAYYLLGLVESRIGLDQWVAEADFYLETAIRLSPKSEIGRHAYDLLEEEKVIGWHAAGMAVPDNVQAHLDELRSLLGDDSREEF